MLVSISLFCEFLGHGSFGFLKKEGWLPFYRIFGFSDSWALASMPFVGLHDVLLALTVLIYPNPLIFLWMFAWGFFTALLRPLAGQGWLEFFERAYNFGVPFVAFYVAGGFGKDFLKKIKVGYSSPAKAQKVQFILRVIICSMLIAHGALIVIQQKPEMLRLYQGIPWAFIIGGLEIIAGFAALFIKSFGFFLILLFGKITIELFHLSALNLSGVLEFVERGSSYFAIYLLIWHLYKLNKQFRPTCTLAPLNRLK